MGRKYDMEYWLHEILKEDKIYGRERLLKIADEFLSRDERKLIRENSMKRKSSTRQGFKSKAPPSGGVFFFMPKAYREHRIPPS
jgi:hypothetical protein